MDIVSLIANKTSAFMTTNPLYKQQSLCCPVVGIEDPNVSIIWNGGPNVSLSNSCL